MSAPPPILEFEFSRDDYLAWVHACQEEFGTPRQWREYRKTTKVFLVVAIMGTLMWCWMAWKQGPAVINGQREPLMLVILGAAAIGLWWQVQQRWKAGSHAYMERQIAAQADSGAARLWQGHKRVTVTPACLRWEARHCDFLIRWSAIGPVRRIGNFLEIEVGCPEQRYPLPTRVFKSQDEETAFIAAIDHHRARAGERLGSVEELLKTRDFKCPGCTYNLRGVASSNCPECGRPIEVAEVFGHKLPQSQQ
jgi:hypothetical protein